MARTKIAEVRSPSRLGNDVPSDGCGTCARRPDRVYADQVWRWALAHPGESVWRD